MIFAQLPDPTNVINSATSQGWQSGLLAFIIVVTLMAIGWILKHLITTAYERETRMSMRADEREVAHNKRIEELELFIKSRLIEALQNYATMFQTNHEALLKTQESILNLTNILIKLEVGLTTRPCFWTQEKQVGIIKDLANIMRPINSNSSERPG